MRKKIVVIGGGFAFSTLRSLVEYILDDKNRANFGDVTVIYGNRDSGEVLYRDDLEKWKKRDDINVVLTIDNEEEGWNEKASNRNRSGTMGLCIVFWLHAIWTRRYGLHGQSKLLPKTLQKSHDGDLRSRSLRESNRQNKKRQGNSGSRSGKSRKPRNSHKRGCGRRTHT